MSIRPFVPWPAAILRTPAAKVENVSAEIRGIWQDMVDTMEAMPGVGLAAPQIGLGLALAVVDASAERGRAILMANPEVVMASDKMHRWAEGSPNLPGVEAEVVRPAEVTVSFVDHAGMRVRREFEGLWARSVQHQIDHLAGRMYFDNLSRVKRQMLLKRARKVAR
ncbi:MAG: peptide deformylase [Pseudomonadota bacterium]